MGATAKSSGRIWSPHHQLQQQCLLTNSSASWDSGRCIQLAIADVLSLQWWSVDGAWLVRVEVGSGNVSRGQTSCAKGMCRSISDSSFHCCQTKLLQLAPDRQCTG